MILQTDTKKRNIQKYLNDKDDEQEKALNSCGLKIKSSKEQNKRFNYNTEDNRQSVVFDFRPSDLALQK